MRSRSLAPANTLASARVPAAWLHARRLAGVAATAALLAGAQGGVRADVHVTNPSSLAPLAAVATGLDRPRGVAAATSGAVYFTDEQRGVLYVVPAGGARRVLLGDLTKPRGLALEDNDHLLLVAERSGRHPANRGGVLLRVDTRTGVPTLLAQGIRHPRGVARRADATIFVTSDGLRPPSDDDDDDDNDGGSPLPGTVLRLSGASLVTVATGFQHPDGIVARADGTLLVAADGYRVGRPHATGSVFAISTAGAVTVRLAEALDDTGGLVEDSTGAVFVAGTRDDEHHGAGGHHGDDHGEHHGDDDAGAIVKRAFDGTTNDLATALRQPAGLALASSGDLLAADAEAGVVWRFSAPARPTLRATDPAFTNQSPFALTGTAAVGTQVLALTGAQRATATPAADGSFTASLTLAANQANDVQVLAVGAAGKALASAPAALRLVHDNVAPAILATPDRPANAAGWYDADVVVTFTCSDQGSGIAVCPAPVTLGTEGVQQSVGGTAFDRAGNQATAVFTANLDKSPPTIMAAADRPPNAAGWYAADVVVTFTCSDAGAGIATCPGPVTLSTEGAQRSVKGTAVDRAGKTAVAELKLNLDKTPPVVTVADSPAANGNGWHSTDVTVQFTCDDALSGVASCPASTVVGTEGRAQVRSGQAVDLAGNTASASVTLNIDKTPPVLTPMPAPVVNPNGWNNTDVTVTFQATDALSGVDEVSPPAIITGEGTSLAAFGSATDLAGNQATVTYTTNIDRTPPSVTIDAPAAASVFRTPSVTVSGSASDANGLAAVHVDGVDAGTGSSWQVDVPLTAEGPHTVTARAEDVAGNVGTATVDVVFGIPPVVHITEPADLSAVGTTPITVRGTVDDPTATVVVGLQAIPAVVNGNTFEATGVDLREGGNVITAAATDPLGNASSDAVTVVLDTVAPRVLIDSPAGGSATTDETISVSGRINDVVLGTVNSGQARVSVNGVEAEVANRTFIARGIPLRLDPAVNSTTNNITATATDAVGNADSQTIVVTRLAANRDRIRIVSGDEQTAGIGEVVHDDLKVLVTDGVGAPQPGRSVVFRVAENNGELTRPDGTVARGLVVTTGDDGTASARFRLGTRAGVGNNRVEVTSPGIAGVAVFTGSGTARPADKINLDSGGGQTGVVGQPLPHPFVAVVTDNGHNRLPGVPVTFHVVEGEGQLAGAAETTVVSDGDGRAVGVLTLGPHAGRDNNVVTATALGLEDQPAAFVASAEEPGDPAATSVSGVVLDNSNVPIPGVTLRIRGTALAATADAQGQFRIQPVPVGNVHLQVDGTTAQRPGTWPSLDFELVTVPGIDNTLGMPIFLVELDQSNSIFVDETHGGTLTLPEVPGFSLTVAPNSATFPDGTRRGTISVTPVHVDKVPMVPNFGQQPRFIVTIQPSGVKFDPPAAVTHPNVDGLKPGEVTEIYSFDHDMGSFVATGTATVSEDGTLLRSDPGMGILKGGWHCGGNPAGAGAAHNCPECKKCDGSTCVPDDGASCDDHDLCTSSDGKNQGPDKCQGGSCQGKKIDFPERDAGFSEDVNVPTDLIEKVDAAIHRIPGLDAITLEEAKAGVEGKVKDCCEKSKGVVSSGIKEVAVTAELKAKVKGLTVYGPPTISRPFNFGFGSGTIDLQLGVKVDGDFTISGKGGHRQDLCKDKDCFFGEIKGATNVTLKATASAVVCFTGSWPGSSRECGSVEITPLSFSSSLSVTLSKNQPECGSDTHGNVSFGNLKFKISIGFGITDPPAGSSGTAEYEGWKITFPPGKIEYSHTILDAFTIPF
jgi:sugar lactone lactonase YvrE